MGQNSFQSQERKPNASAATDAAIPGTTPIADRGQEMQLSEDQFERQSNYETSLCLISKLRDSGLLTPDEFSSAKARLIDKYCPVIQH